MKENHNVRIRPIRPEDDRLLIRVFNNCSPWTIYQRFLAAVPELTPAIARHLSTVDHYNRLALIAEAEREPVGVARYEPTNEPGLVELGMVVVDEWQNLGIGRILLRVLLQAAEGNGIHRFCAHVLGENRRMLHLLTTEAHIEDAKTGAGVTTVWFTTRPPESFASGPREIHIRQ